MAVSLINNASRLNRAPHKIDIASVELGEKNRHATLIRTKYSVMYGEVRSPVRQTSQVIRNASNVNWTQYCQTKRRLSFGSRK